MLKIRENCDLDLFLSKKIRVMYNSLNNRNQQREKIIMQFLEQILINEGEFKGDCFAYVYQLLVGLQIRFHINWI